MNAVITRARPTKAKPAPVISPVADILARISTVEVKLAKALNAADEGSDLAVLIFGIIDNLIPYCSAPLYRTPVSKADVDEAHRELFFPLSVLRAALTMSEGLVMEAMLQQALEILDRTHSDMDCALVQDWPIPDQAPAPNGSAVRPEDFQRGMAVALDLLRAEKASQGQDVTCYRRHREGRAQYRFWRQHIEKLVSDPRLIEGFDAVMSAAREDGQDVGVAELERVDMHEYLPGDVGADGTVPADLESAAPKVQRETSNTNEVLGIELAAANTTSVMRVAAHDANSDAVWGVFKLNELANEAADAALRQADDSPDIDGLWAASSLYAQAIKLCGLVCANADNELVYAGLMLMEITKERVDTLAQAEMDKEAQA